MQVPVQPNGNREEEEEAPLPEWSNRGLPRQNESDAARAAQYFRHRLTPVPVNCALYDRTNKRPSDAPTPTYREPLEPRTAILYDGFLAQSTATISMGPKDVQRLLANEEAELMAAHGAGRCDPDAAPPRSVALTVLIKNSQEEPSRTHLLDSMALLAHDGGPARAATVARFAVLADRDAARYSYVRGGASMGEARELALVYVGEGEGGNKELRMVKTEVPYKDTGKKVYRVLEKTIAALFQEAKLQQPAVLMKSREVHNEQVNGAYVAARQSVNDAFFGNLSVASPAPSIDYTLSFQHQRTFLKIAPHWVTKTPEGLAHRGVCFGMLFSKSGQHAATLDYVTKEMRKQRSDQPSAPWDWPFGLRFPDAQTAEKNMGLHVFSVACDAVSVKGQYSCFGLRASPGERVAFFDNAMVPRLVFSFVPFEEAHFGNHYVLPCTQKYTNTLHNRHTRAQWDAAEYGVRKYYEKCTNVPVLEEDAHSPKRRVVDLEPCAGLPTSEDLVLARMLDTPLDSAFRIGDVYEMATKAQSSASALSEFLVAASARLGPTASMADALRASAELEGKLREANDALREARESHSHVAPQVAPAPVAAPGCEGDLGPFEYIHVACFLRGMNLKKSKDGFRLKPPMTGGRIVSIANTLAAASGREAWPNSVEGIQWGLKNCGDMSPLEAVIAVSKRLSPNPVVLLVVGEGFRGLFKLVTPAGTCCTEDGESEDITPTCAMQLSVPRDAVYMQFSTEDNKIFPLVEDKK